MLTSESLRSDEGGSKLRALRGGTECKEYIVNGTKYKVDARDILLKNYELRITFWARQFVIRNSPRRWWYNECS